MNQRCADLHSRRRVYRTPSVRSVGRPDLLAPGPAEGRSVGPALPAVGVTAGPKFASRRSAARPNILRTVNFYQA